MAADTSGNDLSAVGIPLTGMAAFAPVAVENVIADAEMGAKPLALSAGYKKLGLYKSDGGPQEARDDADALDFFQQGYKIPGDGTLTIQVNLAEDNENVNALIDGKTPDSNGVVYVDSNLPDATFILFVATVFKNKRELRRNGLARVQSVEVDQEERGAVRGKSVTLEWVPDALFNGSPYKKWLGIPGATTPTGVTAGTPGAFTPTGSTTPAALADLQALGALGQSTAWTTGQYVTLGDSSSAHWDGSAWVVGIAG